MPRVSFKGATTQSDNASSNTTSSTNDAAVAPKDCGISRPKSATIKKELVESSPVEQVFHRKSERRRVARDIFLVFEEQPSRSRRARGTGSNRKQSRPKSKFGHLKVEDPNQRASMVATKAGLLRDIKNEPKCYLNNNASNASATVITSKTTPNRKATKTLTAVPTVAASTPTPQTTTVLPPPTIILETINAQSNMPPSNVSVDAIPVARVNPIFLWVKQDDTRIVEVRCEDYDKRNRIRITKTTNGWRAIPRTDPTSSRIVKFFQTTTTPLLKVKREVYENSQMQERPLSPQPMQQECEAKCEVLLPKLVQEKQKKQVEKPKNKKKKKERTKDKQNAVEVFSAPETATTDTSLLHLCIQKNEATDDQDQLLAQDAFDYDSQATVSALEFIVDDSAVAESEHSMSLAETYHNKSPEFQLCPETGLFLPQPQHQQQHNFISFDNVTLNHHNPTDKSPPLSQSEMLVDLVDDDDADDIECSKQVAELVERLDAETKNLKDLLDDADLLQHCGDTVANSSGVDLIDSLVKRSCENNLIQETELLKHSDATDLLMDGNFANDVDTLTPEHLVHSLPQQLIDSVIDSDPPKCLSFNEAGEIEGLNGELFQSHSHFIESFVVKEPLAAIQLDDDDDTDTPKATADSMDIVQLSRATPTPPATTEENLSSEPIMDESPKDLSCKQREEICPPSESRSQCAVTSSSDVVKSPQRSTAQDELTGVGVSVESTSETIKQLILEQFIKLNALNAIATPIAVVAATKPQQQPQQQSEPIDLGKPQQRESTTALADDDDNSSSHEFVPATTNYIETVVIDDNSDDEPVKKRLRNAVSVPALSTAEDKVSATATIIDKDPDPLTQLQLLIRNTQWKVPDPILVPKDRLGAVLASPAREIPLLITTRPELRLPEAFAYPEIIQNPNILVISMAQLEAILKNEMELEKDKDKHKLDAGFHDENSTAKKLHVTQSSINSTDLLQHHHTEPTKCLPSNQPKEVMVPSKCSHIENSSTSLASDINAATLAVLNQMLWLPYFGQLSQEFLKTLKDPTVGMQQQQQQHQHQQNKYNGNNNSNLLPPLYNQHQQFGLQHLDELYKNYMQQITSLKHLNVESSSSSSSSHHQVPVPAPPSLPNYPSTTFQNPVELAIFQKVVQHQMQNFLGMNHQQSLTTDASPREAASMVKQHSSSSASSASSSSNEHSSNNAAHQMHSSFEHKRARKSLGDQHLHTNPVSLPDNSSNSMELLSSEKSTTCLKSKIKPGCDNSGTAMDSIQKQIPDNKPRLTCKSLSNLLEPSDSKLCATAVLPLINLTSDRIRNTHEPSTVNKHVHVTDTKNIGKDAVVCTQVASEPTFRATRNIMKINPVAGNSFELSKQRKRSISLVEGTVAPDTPVAAGTSDANPALWHPLFGSNAKPGYSPWQWTTVTATGE